MKEFRGTIIALVLLGLVIGLYYGTNRPQEKVEDKEVALIRFEKHELLEASIIYPDERKLHLKEKEGVWFVENKGWKADNSMVNRIKHQLHDLDARTKVIDAPQNPTRYGLGKNAIRVALKLSNDKKIDFLVGDPNPSAVSYYMQLLPGDTVYTVKKSAMDYFSHPESSFRDPRFARFDIKDVQELHITDPHQKIVIEKKGVESWRAKASDLDVDHAEMRRILSKAAALKALRFIDQQEGPISYGFSTPQLSMRIVLKKEVLVLELGSSFAVGKDQQAYYRLAGSDTIYVSRASLQDLIGLDVLSLRNRKVCRIQSEDIIEIEGEIFEGVKGTAIIQNKASEWKWSDGSLVSGSTPKRLANALADLQALSFVAFEKKTPSAQIRFVTSEGEKQLFIGPQAESETDPEGNSFPRYYASIDSEQYIIDAHVMRVLEDLIREQGRKTEQIRKVEELHERIEK